LGFALEVFGRCEAWGAAALVQCGPAWEVERQAEAEADARLHLGHTLQHLLGCQQVDATEFVVVTPVAPRRSFRTLTPSLGHRCPDLMTSMLRNYTDRSKRRGAGSVSDGSSRSRARWSSAG